MKGRGPEAAFMNSLMDSIWLIFDYFNLLFPGERSETTSRYSTQHREHFQEFFVVWGQEWVVHDNQAADFRVSPINKSYNFCSHLAQ
jgi:hypothetical protein